MQFSKFCKIANAWRECVDLIKMKVQHSKACEIANAWRNCANIIIMNVQICRICKDADVWWQSGDIRDRKIYFAEIYNVGGITRKYIVGVSIIVK